MSETLTPIQILVQRDACDRLCSVNKLKLQAINLQLDNTYITLLDTWLLSALQMSTIEEVQAHYDAHYSSIVTARDAAFETFKQGLIDSIQLPEVTVSP